MKKKVAVIVSIIAVVTFVIFGIMAYIKDSNMVDDSMGTKSETEIDSNKYDTENASNITYSKNGDPIVPADETAEWNVSIDLLQDVLDCTEEEANAIMYHLLDDGNCYGIVDIKELDETSIPSDQQVFCVYGIDNYNYTMYLQNQELVKLVNDIDEVVYEK